MATLGVLPLRLLRQQRDYQGRTPGLRRVPRMAVSVLIEAVEAEGFGRGSVVASAFGDVQVAGVLDGRDDGGADGGQVGRAAAGAAGGGIFAETHVADVMV